MNELVNKVKQWGVKCGITGPKGTGTLLGQLSKTQEELTETRDAAVVISSFGEYADDDNFSLLVDSARLDLIDGIGDTTVTLILAAEMAGLDFQGCLQAAYDEISGRTGKMIGGQFIKDKP
jgi:hypothetical protein